MNFKKIYFTLVLMLFFISPSVYASHYEKLHGTDTAFYDFKRSLYQTEQPGADKSYKRFDGAEISVIDPHDKAFYISDTDSQDTLQPSALSSYQNVILIIPYGHQVTLKELTPYLQTVDPKTKTSVMTRFKNESLLSIIDAYEHDARYDFELADGRMMSFVVAGETRPYFRYQHQTIDVAQNDKIDLNQNVTAIDYPFDDSLLDTLDYVSVGVPFDSRKPGTYTIKYVAYSPFKEAVTESEPLTVIVHPAASGKVSSPFKVRNYKPADVIRTRHYDIDTFEEIEAGDTYFSEPRQLRDYKLVGHDFDEHSISYYYKKEATEPIISNEDYIGMTGGK